MAEDTDSQPYIYDESMDSCKSTKTCPRIDHSPWKSDAPGALATFLDALEHESVESNAKYCLCAKSRVTMYQPGSRLWMGMEPKRGQKTLPCAKGHSCAVVGSSIHVVS
jgi:hypothetical protein